MSHHSESFAAIFDRAAQTCRDDPRAFTQFRHELIEQAMAGAASSSALHGLQRFIDGQRAIQQAPRSCLTTLAILLDAKLSALAGMLAEYQDARSFDIPGGPSAALPDAEALLMLQAIAGLRQRLAESRLPPGGRE